MNKIRVIDLLNKIANGEEIPKKIKWGEFILVWEELGFHDYKFLDTGDHFLYQGFAASVLNDEVEILEEEKKIPEKIEKEEIEISMAIGEQICANKINEIIDYLKSKGE